MKQLAFILFILLSLNLSAYEKYVGTIDDSKIYPSTVHRYTVTIPDDYNSDDGAALYLGLDGILCNAPERIDSLMATGDIPSMVGVFVEPGVVYDSDGEVLRYNRSNEFDAPDGRFARFLETELLPVALNGLNVHLVSDSTMIFGLSSGGIAAFNAAWQRPDLFGRVFSGCGTFVPMRGADGLQSLVRKSEPRDIKVFLQDGYNDTWNPLFGSWYEANRLLASALEFAGYDCDFDWAEGGHSVRRASLIFPDVMKWLWLPRKSSGTGNATVSAYFERNDAWQKAPACDDLIGQDNALYPGGKHLAEPVDGSNYLWQYLLRDNGVRYAGQPFYCLHSMENRALRFGGMTFDREGNLWVATEAGIQVCDQNGRVRAIVRLPLELEIAMIDSREDNPLSGSRLDIEVGRLILKTHDATYTRTLNVLPSDGIPQSQGQA